MVLIWYWCKYWCPGIFCVLISYSFCTSFYLDFLKSLVYQQIHCTIIIIMDKLPPDDALYLQMLIKPDACLLCDVKLIHPKVAESHYSSGRHDRRLKEFLEEVQSRLSVMPIKLPAQNSDEDLYCDTCSIRTPSKQHTWEHLKGAKHQRTIIELGLPQINGQYSPFCGNVPEALNDQMLVDKCNICNDSFPTIKRALAHYCSAKHDASVRSRLNVGKKAALDEIKPQLENDEDLYCDICSIRTTAKQHTWQHIKGPKHQKKIIALGLPQINGQNTPFCDKLPKALKDQMLVDKCKICNDSFPTIKRALAHYSSAKHDASVCRWFNTKRRAEKEMKKTALPAVKPQLEKPAKQDVTIHTGSSSKATNPSISQQVTTKGEQLLRQPIAADTNLRLEIPRLIQTPKVRQPVIASNYSSEIEHSLRLAQPNTNGFKSFGSINNCPQESTNLREKVFNELEKLIQKLYYSKTVPYEVALEYLKNVNREVDRLVKIHSSEQTVPQQHLLNPHHFLISELNYNAVKYYPFYSDNNEWSSSKGSGDGESTDSYYGEIKNNKIQDNAEVLVNHTNPNAASISSACADLGDLISFESDSDEETSVGIIEEMNAVGTNEQMNAVNTNEEINIIGTNEKTNSVGTNEEMNVVATDEEVNVVGTDGEMIVVGTNKEMKAVGSNEHTNAVSIKEEMKVLGINGKIIAGGTNEEMNVVATDEETNAVATSEQINAASIKEEMNVLGTDEEINAVFTNEEVNVCGTNEEINALGTNEETNVVATDEEMNAVGTNEEINVLNTKEEMNPVRTNEEIKVDGANEKINVIVLDALGTKEQINAVRTNEEMNVLDTNEEINAAAGTNEEQEPAQTRNISDLLNKIAERKLEVEQEHPDQQAVEQEVLNEIEILLRQIDEGGIPLEEVVTCLEKFNEELEATDFTGNDETVDNENDGQQVATRDVRLPKYTYSREELMDLKTKSTLTEVSPGLGPWYKACNDYVQLPKYTYSREELMDLKTKSTLTEVVSPGLGPWYKACNDYVQLPKYTYSREDLMDLKTNSTVTGISPAPGPWYKACNDCTIIASEESESCENNVYYYYDGNNFDNLVDFLDSLSRAQDI